MPEIRSILHVEDNEADAVLVRSVLPRDQFALECVQTAAQARAALAARRFDLVLLDHHLPDANALTFIDEIRTLQPQVPVVILTGWDEETLVISSKKKGAADLVLKDEVADVLLEIVRKALATPASIAAAAGPPPAPSRRRFAEEAERIYCTLLETMSEGCLVIDSDGLVTYANGALGRLIGASAEEPLGKLAVKLFDEKTGRWLSEMRAQGRGMRAWPFHSIEGGIPRADGTVVPVRITIRNVPVEDGRHVLGCLATIADISEQVARREELRKTNERLRGHVADLKQAEAALRESEIKFRSIVETTSEWIWETDREGRITYSNPAVARILGYTPEELVGSRWSSHVHPLDERRLKEVLPTWMAQKAGWTGLVLRWRHRDGSCRFLEGNATPRHDSMGELVGYRGTDRDITERQRMHEELERTRLQQIELKDQFISHISHELRSPLTSIYQYVTILLDGLAGELTAEQRDCLEVALTNVRQLRDMIGDLLEVTRAQAGKLSIEPRQVLLGGVIDEALDSVRGAASAKGVRLVVRIPLELPAVVADPSRVRQVVVNLVENAIKFTPQGGRVEIRAGVDQEESGMLRVAVEDTGCGVAPEDQERIFERLVQGENVGSPSRKGLGLGLYISKELVTRQGGRIWVESEVGRGSTFYFTIPLFSLAQLLAPILTPEVLARGSIGLVTVEVSPVEPRPLAASDEFALGAAWSTIQRCVVPEIDLLLPRTGGTEQREVFFIAVGADARGSSTLARRVEGQLERCHELLEAGLVPGVSVTMLKLPAAGGNQSKEAALEHLCTLLEAQIKTSYHERAA